MDKHTLVTEEVSAHKRELQDTRRVDESLKREEAHIKTHGDANIVDKDTDEGFH